VDDGVDRAEELDRLGEERTFHLCTRVKDAYTANSATSAYAVTPSQVIAMIPTMRAGTPQVVRAVYGDVLPGFFSGHAEIALLDPTPAGT